MPYFNEVIKPQMAAGKRVLIAAHGNSLRALVKYFDNIIWEDVKDTVSAGYKNFKTIDASLQQYDFHLDSLSKANGAADAKWMLPLNREGKARDEKKLNMGCY